MHAQCFLQVLFLNASEEINSNPHEYNALMLNIARSFNLNRIKKCTQIMGREESDDLSAAQIFYPCMQCADIFFLKVILYCNSLWSVNLQSQLPNWLITSCGIHSHLH